MCTKPVKGLEGCPLHHIAPPASDGVKEATAACQRALKGNKTLNAKICDACAVGLWLLTLLNMASVAFVELVAYLVFSWTIPELWYAIRICSIRWAWILPVIMTKRANIRIRVTGEAALVGRNTKDWGGLKRLVDAFRPDIRYMAILNHLSWSDTIVLSSWLHSHNVLSGDTCWPIWKMFINIPLGWVAYLSGCPFLGYGKETDLRTTRRSVTNFFKRRFSKYFIFPEGAIYRPELLEKSHAYAAKNNLPKLDHCLLPKTAALVEAGRRLQQQGLKDILDITIAYPKDCAWSIDPFDVLSLVKLHDDPIWVNIHVKHRSMDDVNWANEVEVREWLTGCWVKKDEMLKLYHDGKGPLVEGAKEEGPTWWEVWLDVAVWVTVQIVFYASLLAVMSLGWHKLKHV